MVNINILKKGDEVLTITDRFLAVKRKNGEIDIYNIVYNETNELLVDPLKAAVIGYGEGTVAKQTDDGETTVFVF